ncbi:MAG: hypothetical protein ACK2UO_01735, partial [Caldilineaceae bacterium]
MSSTTDRTHAFSVLGSDSTYSDEIRKSLRTEGAAEIETPTRSISEPSGLDAAPVVPGQAVSSNDSDLLRLLKPNAQVTHALGGCLICDRFMVDSNCMPEDIAE